MTQPYKKIKLTGVRGAGKFAKVDVEDFGELSGYSWFLGDRRVGTNIKVGDGYSKVSMHRMIMSPPDNMVVDHINGDTLDNRRSNLRICTQAENTRNRGAGSNSNSKYKGVSFSKHHNKFAAYITLGKRKHIGYFEDEKEAAKAYDYYAIELFGEFAYLNFPDEVPEKPEKRKLTSRYKGLSWCSRDNAYVGVFVFEGVR